MCRANHCCKALQCRRRLYNRQRLLQELRPPLLRASKQMRSTLLDVDRLRHGSARRNLLHDPEEARTQPGCAGSVRQHDPSKRRQLHQLPPTLHAIVRLRRNHAALLQRDLLGYLFRAVLRPKQRLLGQDLLQIGTHARSSNDQNVRARAELHRDAGVHDLSIVGQRRYDLYQREGVHCWNRYRGMHRNRLSLQLQHVDHDMRNADRLYLEPGRRVFGDDLQLQLPREQRHLRAATRLHLGG